MNVDSHIADAGESFERYRPWFYAAALYNLIWGFLNIFFPSLLFNVLDIDSPNYAPLWQVVGMFVLVYAIGYWWVARYPTRHPHLVLIGLLGKMLGPIGFAWSAANGDIPGIFGLTIITNDLIWWPSFVLYLRAAARRSGGWSTFLSGR